MKRALLLLSALALLALASMTRAFFPTEPVGATALRGLFIVYALICVGLIRWGPPGAPTGLKHTLLWLLGSLPLAFGLAFVAGHTLIVLFIFLPELLSALLLCVAIFFGLSLRAGLRSGDVMRRLRWASLGVALVFGLAYIPICFWLWSSPDPERCEALTQAPAVQRLTPLTYPAGRSFPYEMLYRQESGHLAAAFKMAGNLSLGLWGDEQANRLALIDLSNPQSPLLSELDLEGEPLPQYMTLGPSRDELIISRPGYGEHLLDYVDLSALPKLTLSRRVQAPSQPHALGLLSAERLVLATMHREVLTLDYGSGEVVDGTPIPNLAMSPGLTITDMALSPDKTKAYLAMFGTQLVEVDLTKRGGSLRYASVGFGAGEVTHHPDAPTLYQTDFFQNELRIIDSASLEVRESWELDFAPRPVALDPERDLVALGDWLGGEVHLRRMSTGERLGEPIPVGPYLREFAIDSPRGLLFTASKCGVHLIDLKALER